MGGENKSYEDIELKENDGNVTSRHVQWVFMENGNGVCSDSESIESTLDEDSSSLLSSSASEVMVEEDDASSASTSSSSPTSSGPLYELSELMDQLPIKRGLSNYYQGKSQSFTSLASVKSLEDLAKKASPYRKRAKPCKKLYSPKAIITKKSCSSSRGSSFVSSLGKNRGTFVGTADSSCSRPSISVVQKHF